MSSSASTSYDVIVTGGGIAGASLAGVLARAGIGVLVVEKEAHFRDRIRGEATWPWGVTEAHRLGLDAVLRRAGCVDLDGIEFYENQTVVETKPWEPEPDGGVTPMLGFSHPRLQETLLAWAASCGATVCRPGKVTGFGANGSARVTVAHGNQETAYGARLVVGADGKQSMARRWTGGESMTDPAHHRFGGVLLSGLALDGLLSNASTPATGIFWFPQGDGTARLYLRLTPERVQETGVDRSFEAFIAYAARFTPDGMLATVQQAGPVGFFPNSDTWATRIASDSVALIGDAAGSADPTGGLGTSLLFRDVRELSELLLDGSDWPAALAEYERRRRAYYDVVHAFDRWTNVLWCEEGDQADRLRERHARAKEHDPSVARFMEIGTKGPDGLVADEAMRRAVFGEPENG